MRPCHFSIRLHLETSWIGIWGSKVIRGYQRLSLLWVNPKSLKHGLERVQNEVMSNEPFNRIGNDIFNIDSTIPNAMGLLINLLFMTIANIIVIIYAIWQFILATVFIPPLIGWKIANENRKKYLYRYQWFMWLYSVFMWRVLGSYDELNPNWKLQFTQISKKLSRKKFKALDVIVTFRSAIPII